MKFTYPAIIRKNEEGTYKAVFPDLACCEAEGDTLDEAVERANEAAYGWIELELSEDDCQLPPVSHPEDLKLQPGEVIRNICVNIKFYEGWDE